MSKEIIEYIYLGSFAVVLVGLWIMILIDIL